MLLMTTILSPIQMKQASVPHMESHIKQFLELQREFPQAQDFGALPDWVKECSAIEGVPLKYAYAMHVCKEQAKISAAESTQRAAANSATRSLKSEASDGTSPEMASVYKALWGQY